MLRAIELLGEDVLHQWYAQSEAWPLTMLLPHQHRDRPRSVGRPTPNTLLRVVDEEGQPLAPGETGEIAVSTPGQMKDLWDDPEGTAARTLPDGLLLTRDMGYLDEQGFVFLVDRKEDMIISGGFNIWPAELEQALATHPAVVEVCVVGVPHERWGETPKAVVVLRFEVVPELPRSPLGKVLRRQVRERYWEGHERRIAGA
jgi:acyl-CoA synthetase (AMP-forming)/AMP-acid ligase II